MKRRKLTVLLAVSAVLIAIGAAVLLRKTAPPEPVRLLPEAQTYLYIDLKPLRAAGLLNKMPPVQVDADYDQFVKETGFEFERDLEQLAVAIHMPTVSSVPDPRHPSENRYSEVIAAHFDAERAIAYLKKLTSKVEEYRGRDIYNVPREDRTVRVCILAPDLIAISNTNDPAVIHGIVDHYHKLAYPFSGPKLVREHYRQLPFGTLAWTIADVAPGASQNVALTLPGGFNLFIPPDTVMVGSLRYLTSIELLVQAQTTSEQGARRITDQLNAFLGVFHMLEAQASGGDPDVNAFFDSIKVQQDGKKAELTASLQKGFFKKVLTEPPPEIQPAAPAPAPEPEKPQPKKHKHKH
jgi:hypothetical protein